MAEIKQFPPRKADEVPVIDRDYITREAVDLIATCKSSQAPGALAAQKNTLELLAKLHNLIVYRTVNRNINSIEDLTDEELALLADEQEGGEVTEH